MAAIRQEGAPEQGAGTEESSQETDGEETTAGDSQTDEEKHSKSSTSSEGTKSPDAGSSSGKGNALERYRENVEKLELTGYVDRSADETTVQSESEWIIAYGALLGKMEKAMEYLEELILTELGIDPDNIL